MSVANTTGLAHSESGHAVPAICPPMVPSKSTTRYEINEMEAATVYSALLSWETTRAQSMACFCIHEVENGPHVQR